MGRMAPSITLFIALVAAYASGAWAEGRADNLQGCQTLAECFMRLDKAELPTGQTLGDEREIADNLRRFGDAAKQELLRRAMGDHRGWRNLAGAVLRYWGDSSPSDVPALRTSLQLEHGGWTAWPLADIGTPDAIQALVEDLIVIGPMSQTGAALKKLGARALPYLLPLLEDERQALQADAVIHDMGAKALDEAANWLALAEGPEHPKRQRLGALRGLAAMGELIQPHADRLRALRSDPDPDLRDRALKTLIAIRDSSVAALVGEKCKPLAAALEAIPVQSVMCIWDVARFGGNGRGAGPNLMSLLQSKNGAERATAIGVLGYIGYDEAMPAIREALRANDWRVVQAAVLSLGWLGVIEAIPDLEQVAASHWLPEVRRQAQAVLDILKSDHPKTTRPERFLMNESVPFGSYSYGNRWVAAEQCPSQKWEWQGRPIARSQRTNAGSVVLSFNDGLLIGSNRGEWGGELIWKREDGQAELVLKDNVIAIEPADGGAMVLFGLAHMGLVYGYAVHVTRTGDGNWSLSEAARMPRDAQALATIGANLFAAWSGGRVVVLSDKEVLGLAACIP